jgi:hypothetical protein
MRKRVWVVLFVLLAIFSFSGLAGALPSEPNVMVNVGGEVTYGLKEERSFDWYFFPGSPLIGSSYAMGDIVSNPGSGLIKAETVLNYHLPFSNDYLEIGADVQTWNLIKIVSDELSDGTSVTLYLDLLYSGILNVQEGVDGKSSLVKVEGLTTVYDSQGQSLGTRTGTASVTGTNTGGVLDWTSMASGDWSDSLSSEEGEYFLSYLDTIIFDVLVGDEIWIKFDLALLSRSLEGTENFNFDESMTYAAAVFSHTGTYTLRSDDNVGFQTVPEPGIIAMLSIGLAGLFALRRRFSAKQ